MASVTKKAFDPDVTSRAEFKTDPSALRRRSRQPLELSFVIYWAGMFLLSAVVTFRVVRLYVEIFG